MECPKCEGLMIEESLPDGSGCIDQWRCVNRWCMRERSGDRHFDYSIFEPFGFS